MQQLLAKPRHKRLLVEEHELQKSEGGIIIPDSVENVWRAATVTSVSDELVGYYNEGDVVIYVNGCGLEVKYGSSKYILLEDEHIVLTFPAGTKL